MDQSQQSVMFSTKLGTAKGVARSRIWIEGKRLAAAGFTVGRHFVKDWEYRKGVRPELTLTLLTDDDVVATTPYKVSGKGEKPIIDITGEMVAESFGKFCTHVTVDYRPGLITICPKV